jgi:hypothetical protein
MTLETTKAMTAPAPVPARADLPQRLVELRYTSDEVVARAKAIYERILRDSPRVRVGNFTQIAAADLTLMYELYDEHFFAGGLGQLVKASGAPLRFELSGRLTRSAGLTKRFSPRTRKGAPPAPPTRFEISLSTTLLFQSFRDVERTIRVNGLVCNDRLEAALRVFEHELLHLLEMLAFVNSDCDAERYKTLAWNLFGHTQTKHDLVTQNERARAKFDVRVGDRVSFTFEGRPFVGVVNRITRRATILVQDERGVAYADGKKYLKFYIPLPMLTRVEGV